MFDIRLIQSGAGSRALDAGPACFDSAQRAALRRLAMAAESALAVLGSVWVWPVSVAFDDTCLLVCESTGGYEAPFWRPRSPRAAPPMEPMPIRSNTSSVRLGPWARPTPSTPRRIASYGRERHGQLARWQEPDRHRDRLQVMVLARQDLVAQRQAFKNRLAAPGVDPVKAPIKAVVACLDTRSVYQRLIAHQKKPIVAITALMRKLIVIANAVVRDATAELKIDAQVS